MTLSIVPITNLQAFANSESEPTFTQNTTMSMHIQSEPTISLKPTQDRQIHLRFFDANNNLIKNMIFSIAVTRENQQLLTSVFYSHSGSLTLNLQPSNVTSWFVNTDFDHMRCNVYGSLTDNLTIYVPIPLQEYTYHFEIQPTISHTSYGCYIAKSMGINFETDLNLLDAYNKTITPQIIPEFPIQNQTMPVNASAVAVHVDLANKPLIYEKDPCCDLMINAYVDNPIDVSGTITDPNGIIKPMTKILLGNGKIQLGFNVTQSDPSGKYVVLVKVVKGPQTSDLSIQTGELNHEKYITALASHPSPQYCGDCVPSYQLQTNGILIPLVVVATVIGVCFFLFRHFKD
jgi:hypothetical protein